MKIAALIIILSCAGLLASAGEATSPAGSHGSHPGDPSLMDASAIEDWLAWAATGNAAAGEAEFEFCRGCHRDGGAGRANGSYPRLAGQHASVMVKQIDDIRSGRRQNHRMLPFVDQTVLDRQQVADVAAYLQAQPVTADNGTGPGTDLDRGRALYERDCARCHGAAGEGDAQRIVPRLSGQHYLYLLREARAIRDGSRGNGNTEMAELITGYDDADLEAVFDFVSRLPVD
jgi:cytochrome c553